MTLNFTPEEKKWITVDLSKKYTLVCVDDAPDEIKESVNKKIEEHKKGMDETFGGDKT